MGERKGAVRSTIKAWDYDFHPLQVFGGEVEKIELKEANLFLDVSVVPPERNSSYKQWAMFCKNRRYSYVIAEGDIKPEVVMKRKAALTGVEALQSEQQVEEIDLPYKVYGFFRKIITKKGEI